MGENCLDMLPILEGGEVRREEGEGGGGKGTCMRRTSAASTMAISMEERKS